jgi:hypothetical protein
MSLTNYPNSRLSAEREKIGRGVGKPVASHYLSFWWKVSEEKGGGVRSYTKWKPSRNLLSQEIQRRKSDR